MEENKEIEFTADNIKISGPKIDGSYNLVLEVGEYEKGKVLEVMRLKPNYKVTIQGEKDAISIA